MRSTVRLFGIAAVFMLVGAFGCWYYARLTSRALTTMERSHRILYELEATLAHAVSIQSGTRGFGLTGDDRFLVPYHTGMSGIQQSVGRLGQLANSDRERARLRRLGVLVDEEIAVMGYRLEARRKGGLEAASAAVADGRGKQALEAIQGFIVSFQTEERRVLEERSGAIRRADRFVIVLSITASLLAVALVWIGVRQLSRLVAPPPSVRQSVPTMP